MMTASDVGGKNTNKSDRREPSSLRPTHTAVCVCVALLAAAWTHGASCSWTFTAETDWETVLDSTKSTEEALPGKRKHEGTGGVGEGSLPYLSHHHDHAALGRAWDVLRDFDQYGTWNTFTFAVSIGSTGNTGAAHGGGVALAGAPVPGDPIELKVDLGWPWPFSVYDQAARSKLTLDFTLLELTPPHRLCWGACLHMCLCTLQHAPILASRY